MAQNLTVEEEDLIESLGRDIEQRQRRLVELGQEKSEVSCRMWCTGPSCCAHNYPQIGARKNLLEIELNEGLVRRREELRLKIEGLGASEAGDAGSEEALEAKTRELKALSNSIDSLQKKIQGEHVSTRCKSSWRVDRSV